MKLCPRTERNFLSVLPLDAMLARYMLSCVRPSVHSSVCPSQVGVLSKRLNESSWFLARELHPTYPKLCYEEIWVPPKIRVLPSGTLPQTLDLQCDQRTRLQSSLWITPTTAERASRGWMRKVHCMPVDCNPLNPLLGSFLDLLYNLFLHCCAAVGKMLTDTSRRAVRLR